MKTLINFRHGIVAGLAAAGAAYAGHPGAACAAFIGALLLAGLDWMQINMGAKQ